jgi:hypothetical protein
LPPSRPWLDAGPPRGHPASSGSALDGAPAGFGPIDAASDARRDEHLDAFASCGRELRRFFGSPDLCRSISSDTPLRAPGPDPDERNHSRPPDRGPPLGTSMPAAFPRSRCLPSYGTGPGALARARRSALSRLAGRHSCRAFSPVCKTPARPLIALLSQDESRPRAPLRLLQVDASTSTTTDHPNISIRGIRGRDDCHARAEVAFRSRQPPGFFKVRGRAKPLPDTPGRDCSRRGLRPNPDRPGHLVSHHALLRRSGATRQEEDAAYAGRPSKGRPAAGRRGAGSPRRDPALTSPRCLLSRRRSQANGPACQPKLPARNPGAFFTTVEARGKTPACALDGPTARPARTANHPPSTRRSAPE